MAPCLYGPARTFKSFTSASLNKYLAKEVEEDKYVKDCASYRNAHLPRLYAAELLHQVSFQNSHGGCMSFNTAGGDLHSTYHKPRFYLTKFVLGGLAMLLALLVPINLGALKLFDSFVQSPNLLKQKIGLWGIHVLVQVPYNRRKLLRDGVCTTLTAQMQHYIDSVQQGDVSSWNAEFERNLDIMIQLVDDENVEKHALESGFYDTLLDHATLLETRFTQDTRFRMYHLIAVLSDHAPRPLHQQNLPLFRHMLSALLQNGVDTLTTLGVLVQVFANRSPIERDRQLRESILNALHLMFYRGEEEDHMKAAEAWRALSTHTVYRREMFLPRHMQAITSTVFADEDRQLLHALSDSLQECAADRQCFQQLLNYDTIVLTLLKLARDEEVAEASGQLIRMISQHYKGRQIIQSTRQDLYRRHPALNAQLQEILAKQ